MNHLVLAFYVLALTAGTVSITQTVLIYRRYRKAVIRRYGFFLLALYLFLCGFTIELYGRIVGLEHSAAVKSLYWIFQAAGGITYVFTAPYFYYALLGIEMTRSRRVVFFLIDAVVVIAAFADIAFPRLLITDIILNLALFGLIAYGLILILVFLKRIAERILRRALWIFVVLSLCFFPLLYLDTLVGMTGLLPALARFEGFSQPLYFFILNILTIVFGLRYFNRPAYMAGDTLTDYFRTRYGITRREQEIIQLLLQGSSTREIGERLYVSAKTVENHTYSIYQKLAVKNRVQLFQLMRVNTLEQQSTR